MAELDYIGKKLKYKGEPDHTARTVEKQDQNWLELSDNKRIPMVRVKESFEEVDPDAFFQNQGTYAALAQVYENAVRGGRSVPQMGDDERTTSVPQMVREEIDWDAPDESPAVLKDPARSINPVQYTPTPLPPPPVQEDVDASNREWLRKHGMADEADQAEQPVPAAGGEQRHAAQAYRAPGTAPAPAAITARYTPVPPNNAFGKLKKTCPVKLTIELEEKIPDVEAIRYINNLFEDSIIDQLASEFTQKLLNDPYLLEEIIKANLEDLVYPDRKKRKAASRAPRKPAAKKNKEV